MYILLTVLIVILAVVLVLLVLVQNSKGGGLASGFSSYNQVGGVRRTTDFLEKATWTLIAVIVVLSVAAAAVGTTKTHQEEPVSNIEVAAQQAAEEAPAATVPQED